MYRLMIKTHNKTGLKYLCITNKDDWDKYTGSGVKWRKHLEKHGIDISTELLYESEDYVSFVAECVYYSVLYDVAISDEFANVIPERGYDNSRGLYLAENNLVSWWRYASEEVKREVVAKRKAKQIENHWVNGPSDVVDDIKKRISVASKDWWKNLTAEEPASEIEAGIYQWDSLGINARRYMMRYVLAGAKKFYSDKESEKYKEWKANVKSAIKHRMANTPFEILSERTRKARLGLSPEKKQKRKEKIQEARRNGSWDSQVEAMKIDRIGCGNPSAKITTWMGVDYTLKEFKKLKLDGSYVEDMIATRDDCYRQYDNTKVKMYESVVCPHCGNSNNGKRPSSFKRWHFDNCKEK
jgi:hypothetical protein